VREARNPAEVTQVTVGNRDDSRQQAHGPEDLEPLEEQTEERQEPEDDYYIRNYVLKESSGADKSEPEKAFAKAAASPGAAEDMPTVPDEPEVEEAASTTASSVESEAPTAGSLETEEPLEDDLEGLQSVQGQEDVDTAVAAMAGEPAGPPAFGSQTFGPAKPKTPETVSRPEPEEELDEDLTRAEVLTATLSNLLEASSDIEAAALVSLDGLAMASALPDNMMEDRVAAMSAAILGLGERASAELGQGSLNQVFVEGDDGYVFLMSAGGKAVLTALAGGDAKIGLVFYDMKHAAAKIADVL